MPLLISVDAPPASLNAMPKRLLPVLLPVRVNDRVPEFSKKSADVVAVKLSVAEGTLPDASITALPGRPPPQSALMRTERSVLCGVLPA